MPFIKSTEKNYLIKALRKIAASITIDQIRDRVENEINTDDAEGSYLRVVWEKQSTLKPQKLSDIYSLTNVGNFSGGAFYVGDPNFWYKQLCQDYGRYGIAYVAKIKTVNGDFVTDDVSYQLPPEMGMKGFSKILVTSRSVLHEGKDFKYIREIGITEEKAANILKEWEDEIVKDLLSDKNIIKQVKEHNLTERKLKRYALDYLGIQAPDATLDVDDLDWDDILREVENQLE